MKKFSLIGKLIVLTVSIFIGSSLIYVSSNSIAEAKVSSSKIAKALNEDMQSEDAGATSYSWNKEDGYMEATLDQNSNMYTSMDEGSVSIWNAYVRQLKAESKYMAKHGLKKYSYIQILDPTDQTKMFLEIVKGKVQYNIGEDLQ